MGAKRAIVSDRPGTTRDIVERRVLMDGIEICFFDTAGARFDSHDPIENEGIQMGIELAKEADLCLLVHPANQELGVILDLQNEIGNVPSLLVVTHMDLVDDVCFEADCLVSNKTGEGVLNIKKKIRTLLGLNKLSENKHISLSQRQQSLFQRMLSM